VLNELLDNVLHHPRSVSLRRMKPSLYIHDFLFGLWKIRGKPLFSDCDLVNIQAADRARYDLLGKNERVSLNFYLAVLPNLLKEFRAFFGVVLVLVLAKVLLMFS